MLAAPHLTGEDGQSTHDGSPHDSRVCPYQDRVSADPQDCRCKRAFARSQQATERTGEQTGDNRHIKSANIKAKWMWFFSLRERLCNPKLIFCGNQQ
jgi:hypothetical protein